MPSVREADRQQPSGASDIARDTARDPGGVGAMYHNWVADQGALRGEKPESGTVVVPVDRDLDFADEQLRAQLEDLGQLLAEGGESEQDALKKFLENLLKGGSPSDPDGDTAVGNNREAQFYGKEQRSDTSEDDGDEDETDEADEAKESRSAPAPKKRTIKAARAEVEVDTDEGADDEDEEPAKESRSADLKAILSEVRKLNKRLSALENGDFLRPAAPSRTAVQQAAGRSVEAARGRAAAAGAPANRTGVVRRGNAVDTGIASRLLAAETVKLMSATRDPSLRERIQQESIEAITTLQLQRTPTINDPQLQAVAHALGIEFATTGSFGAAGGSD